MCLVARTIVGEGGCGQGFTPFVDDTLRESNLGKKRALTWMASMCARASSEAIRIRSMEHMSFSTDKMSCLLSRGI